MVFIKMLKKLEKQVNIEQTFMNNNYNKPFILQSRVIGNKLLLIQNECIQIFEIQDVIDYIFEYRTQFKIKYSLEKTLKFKYFFQGTFDCDTQVTIVPLLVSRCTNQQKIDYEIPIIRNGKRISISGKKVLPQFSEQITLEILILQISKSIQFLEIEQATKLLEINQEGLIYSHCLLKNHIAILNDINQLCIYHFELSYSSSQKTLIKIIDLNQYSQQFIGFTEDMILHGQTSSYKLNNNQILEQISNLDHIIPQYQPKSIESQEAQKLQIKNTKIFQMNDGWMLVNKQYNNYIILSNKIYSSLIQFDITYLAFSKFKYMKIIDLSNQEFLLEYSLIFLGIQEQINNTMHFSIYVMQQHSSNQLGYNCLLTQVKLIDFKYQIDYIGILSAYDIIFKDIKGNCGIVQFLVDDLGQVVLQK